MRRMVLRFWSGMAFLGAVLAVGTSLWLGIEQRVEEVASAAALESRMASLDAVSIEKQLKIAKWYNFQLEQGKHVAQWDYQSIWNLGEGQMGLLQVSELELVLPITHGIGGVAGHDPDSAFPIGGREDRTLLYIQVPVLWREGMVLETRLPGVELKWQVESIQVMPPHWPVDHPPGSALLTLVYDRPENRTIVRCRPGTGTPKPVPEPEMLKKQALFWGISPIFLIPVLCRAREILHFLHRREHIRRKQVRILWKLPEKQPKSFFSKI